MLENLLAALHRARLDGCRQQRDERVRGKRHGRGFPRAAFGNCFKVVERRPSAASFQVDQASQRFGGDLIARFRMLAFDDLERKIGVASSKLEVSGRHA